MLGFLFGRAVGTLPPTPMEAARLSRTQSDLQATDQELRTRLDALELACAGMWRILKSQGFTDDELAKAIVEADEADGRRDGKIELRIENCPHCGRRMLTRSGSRCAWCGAQIVRKPF